MSDVAIQVEKLLSEYNEKVDQVTKEVMSEVAKETVDKLKSSSPRKTGKYASGWRATKDGDSVIVSNRYYQLTHLLENGHTVRNKKGTYGRTRAFPHIAPAEAWANTEVQKELERRLS